MHTALLRLKQGIPAPQSGSIVLNGKVVAEQIGAQVLDTGLAMIPNHGLIILGLLYGDDDFQKSMMVVNTSGWNTDCSSGNLGSPMSIKNGLPGGQPAGFSSVEGQAGIGSTGGRLAVDLTDDTLKEGRIALVCQEGHWSTNAVKVQPA